jgi:cytochrome P450
MLEMLEERKSSTVLDEKRDLMSNWIHASKAGEESAAKEPSLTQQDILGNIFTFLVAGTLLVLVSLSTDPW